MADEKATTETTTTNVSEEELKVEAADETSGATEPTSTEETEGDAGYSQSSTSLFFCQLSTNEY